MSKVMPSTAVRYTAREAGYAVLTGGYIGTMEAVSRGAAEAGGHVIGVTCDEIEAWRVTHPNRWVMEERRYPALRQRITALIEGCDAAIALPGGPGTLTEISEMWNHLLIGAISPRPLILVGEAGERRLSNCTGLLTDTSRQSSGAGVTFAEDINQAFELLKQ
jgi:uncharacterized protein (TIGR00725 family)